MGIENGQRAPGPIRTATCLTTKRRRNPRGAGASRNGADVPARPGADRGRAKAPAFVRRNVVALDATSAGTEKLALDFDKRRGL